jgi:uncharacterized protein
MASMIKKLTKAQLIRPPSFVENGTQLEVYMGSIAYGVSSDVSDVDIYGFCIPPKDVIFPHLRGVIPGFGRQVQSFDQYQQHHVLDASSGKEYDLSIYNIVKYFQLCMDNNPNMIDSLFVPNRCVAFMTPVGSMVRDNRHLFLHKGCYAKYRGYAYSQLHKCRTKNPQGKRKAIIEQFGFDVKFAYHVKRLLLQVEQILMEGDLDLERNREVLKAIRRGDVALEEIENWFKEKEIQLDNAYQESRLPQKPDQDRIKSLLLNCLEEHYGKLSAVEYADPTVITKMITELKEVLARYE